MSALILGVAELGDPRRLGRVGLRTLAFTLLLSSISVLIGVTAANLVRPGEGLSADARAALMDVIGRSQEALKPPPTPKSASEVLLDLIPENPVEAMTRAFQGDMIAVMVFALILGIGVKLASIGGIVWMAIFYTATAIWPEHNPFVDDHVVSALVLGALFFANAGIYLGLGKVWQRTELVKKHPILA